MQPTSSSQVLILPRVAAGEPDAFQACLDRFSPLVWSLVKGGVSDKGQAEDLVQDVFLDLWRCADRYDASRSSEMTFVATIARRRVIDLRRKLGRRPVLETLEEASEGVNDGGLAAVDSNEEAGYVLQAFEGLGADQQRVLKLAVMEGMTHQEISTSIKMPLGTVKSHVRRGLERVLKALRARRAKSEAEDGSR